MNKQIIVSIIAVVALVVKAVLGVEIEQVIQAELADFLTNTVLAGTPIYFAVKKKIEEVKLKLNEKKDSQ